jgi:protein-disulfide isomerase
VTKPVERSNRFPWWGWLIVVAGFALPPILITRWMEPETADQAMIAAIVDDPEAPVIGPADGDVTIVVYTDYRCPVCRRTERAIAAVMATDPKLRMMVKDWPILTEDSRRAAEAALAARWQGRYPSFHHALMVAPGPLDDASIAAIARSVGLDPARLAADVDARSVDIADRLNRVTEEASELKLPGTPGILIGPFLVRGGMTEDQIRKTVAEVRKMG